MTANEALLDQYMEHCNNTGLCFGQSSSIVANRTSELIPDPTWTTTSSKTTEPPTPTTTENVTETPTATTTGNTTEAPTTATITNVTETPTTTTTANTTDVPMIQKIDAHVSFKNLSYSPIYNNRSSDEFVGLSNGITQTVHFRSVILSLWALPQAA